MMDEILFNDFDIYVSKDKYKGVIKIVYGIYFDELRFKDFNFFIKIILLNKFFLGRGIFLFWCGDLLLYDIIMVLRDKIFCELKGWVFFYWFFIIYLDKCSILVDYFWGCFFLVDYYKKELFKRESVG